MSNQSYKQQKEDFVSNLSGGSVSEIAAITAVAPVRLQEFPLSPRGCNYLFYTTSKFTNQDTRLSRSPSSSGPLSKGASPSSDPTPPSATSSTSSSTSADSSSRLRSMPTRPFCCFYSSSPPWHPCICCPRKLALAEDLLSPAKMACHRSWMYYPSSRSSRRTVAR